AAAPLPTAATQRIVKSIRFISPILHSPKGAINRVNVVGLAICSEYSIAAPFPPREYFWEEPNIGASRIASKEYDPNPARQPYAIFQLRTSPRSPGLRPPEQFLHLPQPFRENAVNGAAMYGGNDEGGRTRPPGVPLPRNQRRVSCRNSAFLARLIPRH